MSTEKSIRSISFSVKKQDWRKCLIKFHAVSVKKDYKDVLQGKIDDPKNPTEDKKNKNGQVYNDLMLSMNEDVSFRNVDKCCVREDVDGDSSLVWRRLQVKYDSQTNSSKVNLMKQLNKSKLKYAGQDPNHQIFELEVIYTRLKKMGVAIKDDYSMICILNTLRSSYDNLVESMEDKIDASSDPLTLENLREKISSKYEKLQDKEDDEEEQKVTALVSFGPFKGRYYYCGEFVGHKGADCPNKYADQGKKRFQGTCNYYGKNGHNEADYWKKE